MNLDLLIKLVKLANNNPNEHEANSAARRACKLIAEGNYKFSEIKIPETKQQPIYQKTTRNSSNSDYWKNPFKGGFDKYWDEEEVHKKRNSSKSSEPKKEAKKIKRACSECGVEAFTVSTDLYYICPRCILHRDDSFYKPFL